MRASSSPRRPFHSAARSAALFAAAAVLISPFAAAAPAAAHDQLISAEPAADSTAQTLPAEVTLTFSGELIDDGTGSTVIEVTAPSGADATGGDPEVNGAVVTQPLDESAAEAGAYTVQWRVVSSDGHPIDGEFGFTVAEAAPSPSPTTSAPPATTPPASAPSATTAPETSSPAAEAAEDAAPSVLPWVIGAIILLAAVVILLVVLLTRRRGGSASGEDVRDDPAGR